MQQSHNNIKNAINDLIASTPLQSGQSLYSITQDNSISLTDESGLHTTIWTSNLQHKPDTIDSDFALDLDFNKKLNNLDIPFISQGSILKQSKEDTYTTEQGDEILIRITDASIYLITFASGQY
jgi:hypothetical protein